MRNFEYSFSKYPKLAPRSAALAAFAGWLPLVIINVFFVRGVNQQLDIQQSILHHLYDAGHILELAVLSWLLAAFLWRRPKYLLIVGCAVVGTVHYGLLAEDLENFIARHSDSKVPWHLAFTLVTTVGFVALVSFGYRLARGPLGYIGLTLGLAIGLSNHLVLPGNYPGIHFILAWTAAGLIGAFVIRWTDNLVNRRAIGITIAIFGLLSLISYAVPPDPVIRRALLGSEGSVASPYVARVWTRIAGPAAPDIGIEDSPWFKPRWDLPPIPPDELPGGPAHPIVVLLTIDALRSDVVEGPSASENMVPHILEMGRHSLTFQRVWSPAAYTMPSLRGLFLGTYYLQHQGWRAAKVRKKAGHRKKVPKTPYVAELLEDKGVKTINIRTGSAFRGKGGICRGFGEEIDIGNWAPSEAVVANVLKHLNTVKDGPLFIYSHIFDMHSPYNRGGTHGSLKQRYIAEASFVDKAVSTLRFELHRRGLDQVTYFILTSDHGEAFGEHGHYRHATTMYEEMIRIPLFIEGPGVRPRRVEQSVSLIDLGPTILSLFGVATPGNFMGQSLVPFMRGANLILERPLASDGGRAIRAMLFEDRWKAIVDENLGTEELYDLQKDPAERRNLAEETYATAYFSTLRSFFAGLNP